MKRGTVVLIGTITSLTVLALAAVSPTTSSRSTPEGAYWAVNTTTTAMVASAHTTACSIGNSSNTARRSSESRPGADAGVTFRMIWTRAEHFEGGVRLVVSDSDNGDVDLRLQTVHAEELARALYLGGSAYRVVMHDLVGYDDDVWRVPPQTLN